ncbi:MAG: hypothetical protein FJX62_02535 [Alphaproteobacteria bacterium]|nr:hypothetical protein [Alphaproteobacteria bacterium]
MGLRARKGRRENPHGQQFVDQARRRDPRPLCLARSAAGSAGRGIRTRPFQDRRRCRPGPAPSARQRGRRPRPARRAPKSRPPQP